MVFPVKEKFLLILSVQLPRPFSANASMLLSAPFLFMLLESFQGSLWLPLNIVALGSRYHLPFVELGQEIKKLVLPVLNSVTDTSLGLDLPSLDPRVH